MSMSFLNQQNSKRELPWIIWSRHLSLCIPNGLKKNCLKKKFKQKMREEMQNEATLYEFLCVYDVFLVF